MGAERWPRPRRMPLFRGMRPLKRWRYVAFFSQEVMACAAHVQVGPGRQSFWALLERPSGALRGRTHTLARRGSVELLHGEPGEDPARARGSLRVADDGVLLSLTLEEQSPIEALCRHGREQVWTRKQAGVRAWGKLSLDGGAPRTLEGRAVIDDTAGYHARETEWWWTAGVGVGEAGEALAWNLVSGLNDPPQGSERAVWVGREPHEVPPVAFAGDLSRVRCEDGSELRFEAEGERRRRENLLIVSSDYRAPFGTFSGMLPGGLRVAAGSGVVEHHRARW